MLNPSTLESLAQKLYDILPDSLHHINDDIQSQFKQILQVAFDKMDLVTREEFDVQVKVLARTREKIDALEKQLETLKSFQAKDNE